MDTQNAIQDTTNIVEDKQQIALSAVLLFAPAIYPFLKGNNIQISDEDKVFIDWFVQYGYYIIAIIILSVLIWLLGKYLFSNTLLMNIWQAICALWILAMIIWSIAVLRKQTIVSWKKIIWKNIIQTLTPKKILLPNK